MVVGNGMLAKAFSGYANNDNVTIFASGVSNSKEDNPSQFQREINLLSGTSSGNKLVYFSTCSIYDLSLKNSLYIKHKIEVEKFIQNNFNNYLIFRLPNVIGISENKNTFFNYFKFKILNNSEIAIHENAYRHLIDVSDLYTWLQGIIDNELETNKIIDTCLNNSESVSNIIKVIENNLKIDAVKKIIAGGCSYKTNNEYFLNYLKNNFIVSEHYNEDLIKKYLWI